MFTLLMFNIELVPVGGSQSFSPSMLPAFRIVSQTTVLVQAQVTSSKPVAVLYTLGFLEPNRGVGSAFCCCYPNVVKVVRNSLLLKWSGCILHQCVPTTLRSSVLSQLKQKHYSRMFVYLHNSTSMRKHLLHSRESFRNTL